MSKYNNKYVAFGVLMLFFLFYVILNKKSSSKRENSYATEQNKDGYVGQIDEIFVENNSRDAKIEKIIKLETTEDCLLSQISKMECDSSFLFVLSGDLFVFDVTGKYLRKIGKQGSGPEEYLSITSFFVNKKDKSISIIDGHKNELITYDYEGLYIGKKNIKNFMTAAISDCVLLGDKLFCYSMITPFRQSALQSLNLQNGLIEDYFSHAPMQTEGYVDGVSNSLSIFDNKLSITKLLNDTIFTCTEDGLITPRYAIKHNKRLIDQSLIVEPFTFQNSFRSYVRGYSNDYFKGYETICETECFIFLTIIEDYRMNFLIIDKINKTAVYHQDLHLIPKKFEAFPLYHPKGVLNNCFVAVMECDRLMGLKENYENFPSIQKVISESKEDDNPCLIFYTL